MASSNKSEMIISFAASIVIKCVCARTPYSYAMIHKVLFHRKVNLKSIYYYKRIIYYTYIPKSIDLSSEGQSKPTESKMR